MEELKTFLRKLFILITSERTAALLLSIMSIIISYISLKNDSVSKEIAQKELEILTNDREAYFTVEQTPFTENPDADDYFKYLRTLTISNKGGRISGATIKPKSYLDIGVYIYEEDISDSSQQIYRIELDNCNILGDDNKVAYNNKTKTFSYTEKQSIAFFEFLNDLSDNIEKVIPNSRSASIRNDILQIKYSNYENISKDVKYIINQYNKEISLEVATNNSFTDHDMPVYTLTYTFTDYGEKDIAAITEKIQRNIASRKQTTDNTTK